MHWGICVPIRLVYQSTILPLHKNRLPKRAHLVHLCIGVAIHIVQDVGEEGGVASQGSRVLLRQREQHLVQGADRWGSADNGVG